MTKNFKYWAFISYSHKDEKWAKWLQARLEEIKIPADLLGQVPANLRTERLAPIFRDTEELAASSDLTAEIDQALGQSYFLVVICSPDSALSRWVDTEIRRFIDLGRRKHILLLVIAGKRYGES